MILLSTYLPLRLQQWFKKWKTTLEHFSAYKKRLCRGYLSRWGDFKVVMCAMPRRCSAISAYFSAKARCLSCPYSLPCDEWPINWSRRQAQVESCPGQTYVMNIWFSLLDREAAARRWPQKNLGTVFFVRADWTGRRWPEPTRNRATGTWAVRPQNNDPARSNLFSEGNKKMHTSLWWCHPVCQIPCVRLTRHRLSMKMFHSGLTGNGRQAKAVTPRSPEQKRSLLWYCNQTPARCSERSRLNSVISRAAIKPRGREKADWREELVISWPQLTVGSVGTARIWFYQVKIKFPVWGRHVTNSLFSPSSD